MGSTGEKTPRRDLRLVAYLGIFALGNLLIINAGFLFEGTLTPLGEYRFKTELLRGVQAALGPLAGAPLPLPSPFLEGLDWVKWNESMSSFGNIYLLGELRQKGADLVGFPGYFFVVSVFKMPIATQVALGWALVGLFAWRRARPLGDELFLLVPFAFFAVYFNFFFKAQIGIRFFLVAFPYLYIFAGSALRAFSGHRSRLSAGAIVVCLLASGLSYHPHYLSYMNEFVWHRELAYRYVADSNLDWGQNRWYLRRYLREHPEVVAHPRQPMAGRLLVPVNRLVGVYNHPRYRWLRENFEPVAHVAHSYLVFEVTPEALARLEESTATTSEPTSR